eukprot:scaffold129112_cov22-Tisochrysis_lutea.AAC.1
MVRATSVYIKRMHIGDMVRAAWLHGGCDGGCKEGCDGGCNGGCEQFAYKLQLHSCAWRCTHTYTCTQAHTAAKAFAASEAP